MSLEKEDSVSPRETEVLSRGSPFAPSSLGIGGYLCIRVPLLSKAREMKVRAGVAHAFAVVHFKMPGTSGR